MDQISSVDCITLVLRQPWEGFVLYSGFSCEKKRFGLTVLLEHCLVEEGLKSKRCRFRH